MKLLYEIEDNEIEDNEIEGTELEQDIIQTDTQAPEELSRLLEYLASIDVCRDEKD